MTEILIAGDDTTLVVSFDAHEIVVDNNAICFEVTLDDDVFEVAGGSTVVVSDQPTSLELSVTEVVLEVYSDIAAGASSTQAASSFHPVPDICEEDAQFFYFGWEQIGSSWLIRRQVRATSETTDEVGDSSTPFAAAWDIKETFF